MNHYKIHPMVVGTKNFDKSMMPYQYGQGETYTIPIYSWYIEGGNKKILVDTGEMHPIQSRDREVSINGKIYTFEEGLAKWSLKPEDIDIIIHPKEIRAMEMDVIPPGTHVDTYEAYDIMIKVKEMADLIIPLHEPRFASIETISL